MSLLSNFRNCIVLLHVSHSYYILVPVHIVQVIFKIVNLSITLLLFLSLLISFLSKLTKWLRCCIMLIFIHSASQEGGMNPGIGYCSTCTTSIDTSLTCAQNYYHSNKISLARKTLLIIVLNASRRWYQSECCVRTPEMNNILTTYLTSYPFSLAYKFRTNGSYNT